MFVFVHVCVRSSVCGCVSMCACVCVRAFVGVKRGKGMERVRKMGKSVRVGWAFASVALHTLNQVSMSHSVVVFGAYPERWGWPTPHTCGFFYYHRHTHTHACTHTAGADPGWLRVLKYPPRF